MNRRVAVRTLYVLQDAHPCPESTLLAGLLAQLPREVVEPAVWFLRDGPLRERWPEELHLPATLAVPAGAPGGRAALGRALAAFAGAAGTHLIHAMGASAALHVGRAARAVRPSALPYLWSQTELATWRRAGQVRAALLPARAIVLHTAAAEHAQHRLNPRRIPCRRATAGVVLPDRLREHRRADARESLSLQDDAVVAGSLAPLGDPGHAVFLRAAASLCHARAHARLLVLGSSGTLEAAAPLHQLADSLGIGGRLTCLAPADTTDGIEACDIVAYAAADPRALPVGLLQAMAAGLAVIAADQPLVREIVTHGVDALLAPGTDHERLALQLLALADDPQRRLALGAAAAAAVRVRHDAAAMAADLATLYHEVLRW